MEITKYQVNDYIKTFPLEKVREEGKENLIQTLWIDLFASLSSFVSLLPCWKMLKLMENFPYQKQLKFRKNNMLTIAIEDIIRKCDSNAKKPVESRPS